MDIDIRRQNRHQDLVGVLGDIRHLARLDGRRRVHNDMGGVSGTRNWKARVVRESFSNAAITWIGGWVG
jgi:hypothetical protein